MHGKTGRHQAGSHRDFAAHIIQKPGTFLFLTLETSAPVWAAHKLSAFSVVSISAHLNTGQACFSKLLF
eukprot:1143980-Pelagomonas_calceolata.AAC.6